MRVLFSPIPAFGHFTPLVPLARALVARIRTGDLLITNWLGARAGRSGRTSKLS